MSKQQTLGYKGQLFMLDLSYIGWALLASLPPSCRSGSSTSIFQDPGLYFGLTPAGMHHPPTARSWVWSWCCACGLLVCCSTCPTTSARSWATLTPPSTPPASRRARPPGSRQL